MDWESVLWNAVELLWAFWWLYVYLEFCRRLRKDKSNIVTWVMVVCFFSALAASISQGDLHAKSSRLFEYMIVLTTIPFFAKPRPTEVEEP